MRVSGMDIGPTVVAGVQAETAHAVAAEAGTRALLGMEPYPIADGPTRVLVIEDDPDLRQAMVAVLEACGYPAFGAANGRDALAVLHEGRRPGLIVLDLMMPVMDGWQFRIAQLRQDDLAAIPTVVCTARTDAEVRALSMGAVACLCKPLDFDSLLDLVEAHCPRP
jgi:CheY-like chemotaxis protein